MSRIVYIIAALLLMTSCEHGVTSLQPLEKPCGVEILLYATGTKTVGEADISTVRSQGFSFVVTNCGQDAPGIVVPSSTASFDQGRGLFVTGRYWPSSCPHTVAVHSVCPSLELSSSGGSCAFSLDSFDGGTDLLVSDVECDVDPSSPIQLAFSHPLAYVHDYSVEVEGGAGTGYSVEMVRMSVKASSSATYRFSTGQTDAGWLSLSRPETYTLFENGRFSPCMFIPGECFLTVEYKLKRNGTVCSDHTGDSASHARLDLQPGKKSVLALTIPLDSNGLDVSVTIQPWDGTGENIYENF